MTKAEILASETIQKLKFVNYYNLTMKCKHEKTKTKKIKSTEQKLKLTKKKLKAVKLNDLKKKIKKII